MKVLRSALLFALLTFAFCACSNNDIADTDLPLGKSALFSGSGNCVLCHQSGGTANTLTATGEDVSQPTHWRSTMMANAAKDPFWQAMVRTEAAQIPELADVIQDRCTKCHIPMGRREAHNKGDKYYTLDEGLQDPHAMDGVSCTLCHQVQPGNLGTAASFSGRYEISPERVAYGPYQSPVLNPMKDIAGYEPKYGKHMNGSEMCAVCHTLFTPYVDDENHIVGEFPEQTPFIEWQYSAYPAEGTGCQTCHMPLSPGEPFPISTLGPVGERFPFFMHHFVGGNAFMLQMLKGYGNELGVTADGMHFDSTMARTLRQVKSSAIRVHGSAVLEGNMLKVDVSLRNLTGHKFPTGFPSRRAWLHVTVRDKGGAVVFESGKPDSKGRLALDGQYEPHRDIITSGRQVQIYEALMKDVNGKQTFQLLRGAAYLKDNRIPPRGFTSAGMTSDTVGVAGLAAGDPDFNRENGRAGTGGDRVHYYVDIRGRTGPFTVNAEVLYQTINPDFLDHLFEYAAPEITRFKGYYGKADKKPVAVASMQFGSETPDAKGIGSTCDYSSRRIRSTMLPFIPNSRAAGADSRKTATRYETIEG